MQNILSLCIENIALKCNNQFLSVQESDIVGLCDGKVTPDLGQ